MARGHLVGALGLAAALALGCGGGATPASKPVASAPAANPAAPSAPASAPTSAPAQAAAPTAPPAPMRLRLAYTALSGAQLPVWVAQDAGLFKKHGLDAELSYIATSQTAMGALFGGEIDALSGAAEAALAVAVEGGDAVVVGNKLNRLVQAMYVPPGVTEPTHLRGKTVGVTRINSLSGTAARYLFKTWGLETDRDVSLLQTGGFPETIGALAAGGIDAAMLPPPQTLRARELGFQELANLWSSSFEYPGSTINMRRATTPEAEELTRRTLRAVIEAIYVIKTDRALSLQSMMSGVRNDDRVAAEDGYEVYAPLYERDLRLSRAAFQTALDEFATTNPRAATVDPDTLNDPRFLNEIVASGFVDRLYAGR